MTELSASGDTGERRRASDAPLLITELIDEDTVQSIAQEAWSALIGDDEFLVPLPGGLPDDAVSSWVEIVGPWTGAVVLTCGRSTAEALARCLMAEHAPPVLDADDIQDALGELANVVGGNVKAVLPGPSVLGLPEVGSVPPAGHTADASADTCRVDLLWRGQSLIVTVQGSAGAPSVPENNQHENEVPL
ncbi:chemotaxis phosphatase CheX-like protein [Blastococcus colisei]|uniref:Chemotaxis phosphatase CheX-like protein n=1 Tax=Blastococcus colisei TaxID=1564162 RepID=A0A543P9P1_9ACTN|nr:chemotaxis protein CheX [Blastococcus colisei]TQN40801.1 chemotaxis phosphatase CheX-like protein [Blastococcus colisei]